MTLIIAFKSRDVKGGEAIIISSDSKETYGPTTYRTKKIFPVILRLEGRQVPLAITAGSGDVPMFKNMFEIVKNRFEHRCIHDWDGKRPSYNQFEDTVHYIEQEIMSRLRVYRENGLAIKLSIIVGGVDPEGKASLWEIDDRGVAHKADDFPGYACIGSGFFLGGNLLLQMFLHPDLQFDVNIGSRISAFIINQVSQIDRNVGPFEGESHYFDKNGMYSLDASTALPKIQKEFNATSELLRKVFLQSSVSGAEALDKKISRGLELVRQEQEQKKEEQAQKTKEGSAQ